MKTLQSDKRGFAIAATLLVIVLLSILVIGLLETTKLDRSSASSNMEGTRAEVAAERGVEEVVSALWKNTTGTNGYTDPNRLWVSQPGRLVVGAAQDTPASPVDDRKVLTGTIPLSSAVSSATSTGIFAPAALNIPILTGNGSQYTISNGDGHTTPSAMYLKWIYLRNDGTCDVSEAPDLSNKTNPIVSRYAYWTDDESTKLNINLAWKRDQTEESAAFAENHPSHVDLAALGFSQSGVQSIHDYVFGTTPGIAFNSFSEAKRVADSTLSSIIDANKFGLTHFNNSQPFVSDPIYLTTDINLMNALKSKGLLAKVQDATSASASITPNFIDILSSPGLDPGYLPYLDSNRLNKVISTIRKQLLRTDWTLSPGTDLITKWYGTSLTSVEKVQAADQIAMNIIDYVRMKESTAKLVVPIVAFPASVSASPTYKFTSFRSGSDTTMYFSATTISSLGTQTDRANTNYVFSGRAPVITEMTMVIDGTPVSKAQAGNPGGYWPTKKTPTSAASPPTKFADGIHLNGVVTGGSPGAVLYRCKVYIELYLPKYEGLPNTYAIDFSAKGGAAWPGGTAELPPQGAFGHGSYTTTPILTLENDAKWFLGLPDEISTYPDKLVLDSSKDCNVVGNSTDFRNHVTYYFKNEAGTLMAATYGGRYADNNNFPPLSWQNYEIPVVIPSDFMNGAVLKPGQRITIAKEFYRTASQVQRQNANMRVSLAFGVPTNFGNQSGLSASAYPPFAVAMAPLTGSISIPLQTISSSAYNSNDLTGIKSLQINDPKLGYDPTLGNAPQQWQWLVQTFGRQNANCDVGGLPSLPSAQQDLDSNGNVSEHGVWWMPRPAASGSNNKVTSLGGLGAIHTGMSKKNGAMVPWRTLRLQPNRAGDDSPLPDWILLDAFAVPPTDYSTAMHPGLVGPNGLRQADLWGLTSGTFYGSGMGGLVNLNSTVLPTGLTSEQRTTALAGLFSGAKKTGTTTFSATEAATVAANIAGRQLANGGKVYGNADVFETPAKVIEYKGVADGGEESEETVRDVLMLAAVRGNVFSVYTIGQALKQTKDGKLIVTAESRRQVMLQRSEQSDPSTSSTTTKVKIGTLYSRDLHP